MTLERTSSSSSLVDVLDRVLDKGIVIDAWVRISLVGIDLVTVEARVVVASIATYLQYSDAVGELAVVAAPARSTGTSPVPLPRRWLRPSSRNSAHTGRPTVICSGNWSSTIHRRLCAMP